MTDERPPLPFAQQRIVFLAILSSVAMFVVAAAVVLQTGDGKGLGGDPIPMLDTVALAAGAAVALAAFALRPALQRAAEAATGAARSHARFRATLIPLALLEGGCLLGIVTWMLNGNAVPGLVVALVLFAAAVAIVPFTDSDAGAR
jgi:hypothetical protein